MNSLVNDRHSALSRRAININAKSLNVKSSALWQEFKHLGALIRLWRFRAKQRKQIASMPDYLLKDIGVSRYDANVEADKRFWES